MLRTAHIAVDLGAETGRVIVGAFEGGLCKLHECHRFEHAALPMPAGLSWDLTGLWRETLRGLTAAAELCRNRGLRPLSVGVDTWGVDFALLSRSGELLGLPRSYRDPAFAEVADAVRARVSPRRIYAATGIQMLPFNSLYQYVERSAREPELFASGARLMFLPDLLHWLLSGREHNERTVASTSQMLDVRTGDWHDELLQELDLPRAPLHTPTPPGTDIGPLRPEVERATGLPEDVRVVLPPSHDTAAAIAAVPADPGSEWCYLSSGTWSLLGAELREPETGNAARAANFTNELGFGDTVRFLKNISGLWLVQELRRGFAQAGVHWGYAELTEQAAGAVPLRTLIPVADRAFLAPPDMAVAIQSYAKQTRQPVPQSAGALVRCCLESLALEYRRTLELLEKVLGRSFDTLHIVGGGSRNGLLNRMAAHATERRVVVGPEEATAMGNLLTQAHGLGRIDGLAGIRRMVRASFEQHEIEPGGGGPWSGVFQRYVDLPPARR